MKKRIIVYSSIFAILLFIILIIGNYFYNFNAFAADSGVIQYLVLCQ